MRATLFKDGLEFQLEVKGERWIQGQKVEGELTLKNQKAAPIQLNKLSVRLAWGDFKKVKARDAKAFTVLQTCDLSNNEKLESGSQKSWNWDLALSDDCQITEKGGSLYVIFGDEENKELGGDLQLTVDPKDMYKEIIKLMENFLRFKMKDINSKKGIVNAKFQPPASKDFASLDSMVMGFGMEGNNLKLNFEFKTKKIDLSATNTDLKMTKNVSKHDQIWDAKRYLIGKSLDQDYALKQLQAALEVAKTKTMI